MRRFTIVEFLSKRKISPVMRHPIAYCFFAATVTFAPNTMADSSSPLLAAYYDDFLAICGGNVYEWRDRDSPRRVMAGAKKVGVGKTNRYALSNNGTLVAWKDEDSNPTELMNDVVDFYAGRSGLLIIRSDSSLWEIKTESLLGFGEKLSTDASRIGDGVVTASVGDGANYHVNREGSLFVKGKANRGQYGDGKLTATDTYVHTFSNVVQVVSHTGHALILRRDGTVWGTGGNIYGPLGNHGYGDKAIAWGQIMEGVSTVATGHSHSLAIKPNGTLWIWGRNESLDPTQVMTQVVAVAAGNSSTIALRGGTLWQWETGAKPVMVMACKH